MRVLVHIQLLETRTNWPEDFDKRKAALTNYLQQKMFDPVSGSSLHDTIILSTQYKERILENILIQAIEKSEHNIFRARNKSYFNKSIQLCTVQQVRTVKVGF